MVGILKSILYMFIFFFILRVLSYVFRFVSFFLTQRFKSEIKENDAFKKDDALKMLQCEKCKVYVAKSEAYIKNGKIYCKEDHSL